MAGSKKVEWRSVGDADYIKIETRPPRLRDKDDKRVHLAIEDTPWRGSGACDAFQEIIFTMISMKPDDSEDGPHGFYKALREVALEWRAK